MSNLEQKYIEIREVAEMVEKNHKYLMRDIRMYSTDLTGADFSPVGFLSAY